MKASTMSNDCSSTRSAQLKSPQRLTNENEVESPSNQMPLTPSRAPLSSIPDPSQLQSKTHNQLLQHHSKEKPESSRSIGGKKFEAIAEMELMSSFLTTPRGHTTGKAAHSEPGSAQSIPQVRSGPKSSNISSTSSGATVPRLPCQLGSVGGRGGFYPRVSRRISVSNPEELPVQVSHFELDEDPGFWENHNVQVLIRIRPLNNNEIVSQGYERCVRQESSQSVVWLGHPETRFTFDHVACESTSQEKLFRVVGLPMVDNCMSGYNSCIFAYGQTGSGKTYTMMGETDKMNEKLSADCGITSRIFEYLFTKITKEEEDRKNERLTYSCKCSFLEIYNEQITDLLEHLPTNLQLREDSKKGVYVENLTQYSVRTANDVLELLQQGAANRKIAATHMNSESSRSHSVFTCIIESRWEKDSMVHLRFGRLNLVDLAGSERQKSSGAEGERLKEAANINKSLSTLGMVIMSLVDRAHGKHRHVPYRDSRLTFLLQDSLGGNSKTTIIANISPSTCSVYETLSTLKFAQRAKLIQNNAKINEDASGDVIALQRQIQQLKDQLSFLMKHQHASLDLPDFALDSEKYSLGYFPGRSETFDETNVYGEHKIPRGGLKKMKNLEDTLSGALHQKKLTEMEVKRLRAEIERMNLLVHQQEEEAQCTKTMIRLRDEKIQHLESLLNGPTCADKFYQDENNALREEIKLLQEKIDKHPEVNRLKLENFRLREQIRMYQDFCEQGERERLLDEISGLHNQGLEVERELQRCKEMNTKLIREVDELQHQLVNSMSCNQDTLNSTENILRNKNLLDEATSSSHQCNEAYHDTDGQNIKSNCDDVHKQLMDAQSLLNTLKLGHVQLNKEPDFVQPVNQKVLKVQDNGEIIVREFEDICKGYGREITGSGNHYPNIAIEVNDDTDILTLQAKLDELYVELKEAQMLNGQYIKERTTWLSNDNETKIVQNEVELEATKAIMHLQEEMVRLQEDFQMRLCSLVQQNLSLKNSISDKEEELRFTCSKWESATLELTTFLTDGFRSLGDAATQITSISHSFPSANGWVSEHVERAAKICVEKEQTILLLQKSLEDAQKNVMQMEQKLYSLKCATVVLTKYQQFENFSSGEKLQCSKISVDSTDAKEFLEQKPLPREGQTTDDPYGPLFLEKVLAGYSIDNIRCRADALTSVTHKTEFGTGDSETASANLILSETEDTVNGSRAEIFLCALKSDIHNTVSLCKDLIKGVLREIGDMRKDIVELKGDLESLQFSTVKVPPHIHLRCEDQLQMLQQIQIELVKVNDQLSSVTACFHQSMNKLCCVYSTESSAEMDGESPDCSNSFSDSSVQRAGGGDKFSSSKYGCENKPTEPILDPKSDEETHLSHNTVCLLFRNELTKAYKTSGKLKEFKAVSAHERNQSCALKSKMSNENARENSVKLLRDVHGQHNIQRFDRGSQKVGELADEGYIYPTTNFFTKIEEAYETMEEADDILKAMLLANEKANMMTALWKQSGKELMEDKENLIEEIKRLKFCILLKDGENEVLQDQIQFSFTEIANTLSSLEEIFIQMQTALELSACSDSNQVVEETKSFFCSSRSWLDALSFKAIQSDICMLVLQRQMGEYVHRFRRIKNITNADRPPLQEHSLITKIGISNVSWDDDTASHPVECRNEGDHIADKLGTEIKEFELVHSDTENKNSELKKELEHKDVILKGLLSDFSLLQELASQRKDIKDELEKFIVASNELQDKLQIRRVQLDDMQAKNAKLEGQMAEAERAIFNSKSELDQAIKMSNVLSEQNVGLKVLLEDLYLKKSEAEQLVEDQREAIKNLENEIIRLSSSPEKNLELSIEDVEKSLTRVTAERDQLFDKLGCLQDRLDMACALADENQAIAAEARQDSEASKIYAVQKEEEVKILERSVEELEHTINVLEKKVQEMEEEIEKHCMRKETLELEFQALRRRLTTVEDFTETMQSDNTSSTVPEHQPSRKLHIKALEVNEAHSRLRYLEEKNAEQAHKINQLKDYISELVLHAEAQASQYQQKYKNLEAMVREVKPDFSFVSVAPTVESADKISTKTRGSSSPFRCIASLVQHVNQEKDRELSNARLQIEELEALAASRHKEVCVLNTRLASAENMTHDVIRDLLSVKLDITNYANIVGQHQLQKLIKEVQHQRREFAVMEQEIVNLRSHINELHEDKERCIIEVNKSKADQLGLQIMLEQLQQRDQMLIAQNDMLKIDKSNLQMKVTELDDMVKKLLKMQDGQHNNQQQTNSLLRWPFELDLDERLARSRKVLSRINNEFELYRKPEDKLERRGKEKKLR
ncbi:phragmoplast orienting kinesin-1 [Dorcoceras hygrometricum]|uniref:Phragmoplast orienting kinesin-1 n=1 Tax=Dorcoceras hygrometricum TaxID=472368 RepID=A0A2Z7BP22_9LAMI|nr:phragmoplast orienting kinesin-1 [Dorcoceras hygrometricum]